MFTGIIQGTAKVISINKKSSFCTHIIEFPDYMLEGLEIGASVAHNGCCLTVTKINGNNISFDLINETLQDTNLGDLTVGDSINIERTAKFNDEIGGHIMSGHIMSTVEIINILTVNNNWQIWLKTHKPALMRYIFYKGFIGIDGISLTIGQVMPNSFCVNLIPETLRRTTFCTKKIGNKVNVEIDTQTQVIVDTIERIWSKISVLN